MNKQEKSRQLIMRMDFIKYNNFDLEDLRLGGSIPAPGQMFV